MTLYEGDSFFTLGVVQQIGLLLVTVALSLLVIIVVSRASRPLPLLVGMLLGLVAFYLFVWISPQIYYAYYRLIFEGLPQQWVIGRPPNLFDPLRMLSFTAQANLSQHGQGLLGWFLILVPFFSRRRQAVRRDQ